MAATRKPASIDWAQVRHRLEVAGQQLDEEFAPSAGARAAILEQRARRLAIEPPPPPGPSFEALEFMLAREHYALETCWIREVFPLREYTILPGAPDFVLGIIHVRGRIVSVLDIKKFFELPSIGLSDLNKVIILGNHEMEFGILGDSILGVRRFARDDLQAALPTLSGIRADYLMGITRQREVVLDGLKLLTDPAIVIEASVA